MSRKNRPTLKQQFSDFINRVAPFDGNPLIQKTEHEQVETDLFDSLLTNTDSAQAINNPGPAFAVDFLAFDLYNVNSSASIDTAFTITVNNLGTGQLGRISITKKVNDTYSFANASFAGISNLNQIGLTSLKLYVLNVNGTLFVISNLSIAKSDSINSNNSDQLATSKAVFDLEVDLDTRKSDKTQPAFQSVTPNASGSFNLIDYEIEVRETDQGEIQFAGFATYEQPGSASPFISLGLIPVGLRPNRTIQSVIATDSLVTNVAIIGTDGLITGLSPGNGNTRTYYFDVVTFVKTVP